MNEKGHDRSTNVDRQQGLTKSPPDLAIMLVATYRAVVERLLTGHRKAGLGAVRPLHGFVIRAVAAESPSINRLAEMLDTSKQFASKLADEMVRDGYLRRTYAKDDRRTVRLLLSAKGAKVRRTAIKTSAALERELERAVGRRAMAAFRKTLMVLLEQHGALDEALACRARPVW